MGKIKIVLKLLGIRCIKSIEGGDKAFAAMTIEMQ